MVEEGIEGTLLVAKHLPELLWVGLWVHGQAEGIATKEGKRDDLLVGRFHVT